MPFIPDRDAVGDAGGDGVSDRLVHREARVPGELAPQPHAQASDRRHPRPIHHPVPGDPVDRVGLGSLVPELDFEVDDVDATFLRLKAAGVQIETEPVDHEFGRNFDARDPDGYRLTFFTFGPGAWATHADEQTE